MEWWLLLLIIFGSLLLLMSLGLPIAFSFLLIAAVGAIVYWQGEAGLRQLTLSMFQSLHTFTLMPLALFILMGEALFRSDIGPQMIGAVDKLMGRLPGRLGLVAVAGGAIIATLSGSGTASTVILGSTLSAEMEDRGYKKSMSLGPVMAGGTLAPMIPPSSHAVIMATIADISLGTFLIAIIVPGLLMAGIFSLYIILRCWLQPSIAPSYEITPISFLRKIQIVAKYLLPVGFIIFLVIGVILLGVATPSEAAATGAIGVYILIACYRRLNWDVVKRSVTSAMKTVGFILLILSAAVAYSQILAFSGASRGLVEFVLSLEASPIWTIAGMHLIALILGGPIGATPVMMITLPMFMPIVAALGLNPIWFAAGYLINMELSGISPPFGLPLFAMRGVAPEGTTMGDVFRASLPFLACDVLAIALVIAFPILALWLPSIMR